MVVSFKYQCSGAFVITEVVPMFLGLFLISTANQIKEMSISSLHTYGGFDFGIPVDVNFRNVWAIVAREIFLADKLLSYVLAQDFTRCLVKNPDYTCFIFSKGHFLVVNNKPFIVVGSRVVKAEKVYPFWPRIC